MGAGKRGDGGLIRSTGLSGCNVSMRMLSVLGLLYLHSVLVLASVSDPLQEGDSAFFKGDYTIAIRLYSTYIEKNPSVPIGYSKRSAAFVQQRKFREAVSDLDRAVEVDPNFNQGYLNRGRLLRQSCRFEDAEKDFQRIFQSSKDHSGAKKEVSQLVQAREHFVKAVDAFGAGDDGKAEELLNKVIGVFCPECLKARLLRAKLFLRKKDYEGVVAESGLVLKQDETNLEALLLRGQAYFYLGDHDLALKHFQSGLRLDPEASELKKEYRKLKSLDKKIKSGDEALSKGKFRVALDDYTAALAIAPENALQNSKIHLGICRAAVKIGRGKDAVKHCTAVLDFGESVEARSIRAEAKILVEDWEGAVADFQEAIQQSPQDGSLREGLRRAEKGLKVSKQKDWYKTLGVDKSASVADIKRAYKKLALQWHPDKNVDNQEEASAKFREIAEAYEILGNEESRGRYDRGEDVDPRENMGGHPGGFPGGHPFFQAGGQTFTFHF